MDMRVTSDILFSLMLSFIFILPWPFWRDCRSSPPGQKSFHLGSWAWAMSSSGSGSQPVQAKGMPRKAPPAALQRQMINATNRVDDASSTSSWTRVEDDDLPPANLPLPRVDENQEVCQDGTPKSFMPPPPPAWSNQWAAPAPPAAPAKATSATNAPVLQAAQGLLDHSNENPTSRRLRRQQEQAARRGRRGVRWGQLAPGRLAHNPLNTVLPGRARGRDRSWCLTIVTDECKVLFRDGSWMRC